MTNIKPLVGFLAGLLTGSAVTYIFTKTSLTKKHVKELNEVRANAMSSAMEIAEQRQQMVKSTDILKRTEDGNIKSDKIYDPDQDNRPKTTDLNTGDFKERDVEQYHDYAKQYAPQSGPTVQVVNPGKPEEPKEKKSRPVSPVDDRPMSMIPYAIDPDDFGEIDDYDTVYLTYFADGVLSYDDNEDTIEPYDLENTVGTDFKDGFGEFSDTTVWIRNNQSKIDYQIEKSHDHYYGDD